MNGKDDLAGQFLGNVLEHLKTLRVERMPGFRDGCGSILFPDHDLNSVSYD
jgi:hypothetical protein